MDIAKAKSSFRFKRPLIIGGAMLGILNDATTNSVTTILNINNNDFIINYRRFDYADARNYWRIRLANL